MARVAMATLLCACSMAADQELLPAMSASAGSGGGALDCPAEVGLPGHEAQFHFQPIAGIEGSAAIVVGTDIIVNGRVYEGVHDCTLAREVRFHLMRLAPGENLTTPRTLALRGIATGWIGTLRPCGKPQP